MRSTPSYYREQIDGPDAGHNVAAHAEGHHSLAHPVSPLILIGVFVALMVLTIITVAATKVDLGYQYNLIIALAIAVVKAVLVVAYFMHLRWDSPLYTALVGLCLLFIAVFIGFTILDSGTYKQNLNPAPVAAAP